MWILLFSAFFYLCTGSPVPGLSFDQEFIKFVDTNGYKGGQVGVVINDRLAFTKGYGKNHEHEDIYSTSQMQISALSKAFTAVTVLKIVEQGQLTLDSKVFGDKGILKLLKPWKEDKVDQRLYDITVDNLLRHTAGWDHMNPNMYDPMLNSVLLSQGYNIKNISGEMKQTNLLSPFDIIRYMMSEPLDYTPGTKSIISNLGYVILGRVIEEVTDDSYQDFVKKHVLIPCGMMHTRIGRPHVLTKDRDGNEPIFNDKISISPNFVDAALGWESNIYDLMRFSQCLDGSTDFKLLSDQSLKSLIEKPKAVSVQHSDTWIGAGFHVNSHGAIWMESELYTDDLLFYHKGPIIRDSAQTNNNNEKPTSWVALLTGKMQAPIRNIMKVMVTSENNWSTDNNFFNDVADVKTKYGKIEQIVKYKLEEHHLEAFVHAIALLRYDIRWMHGFYFKKKTYFIVIAEKSDVPIYDRVIVRPGMTEAKLYRYKLHKEKMGFNLTFLLNYRSESHDHRFVILGIFRKNYYRNTTIIRYGIQHYTQSYKKLLELYGEEGFHSTSQSLIYDGVDGLVTFVLEEDLSNKQHGEYKSYEDISKFRLDKTVTGNARYKRKLTYLDVTDYFGKPKYSAVFKKDQLKTMLFNSALSEKEMDTVIKRERSNGLLPRIIVGYNDKGTLKYTVYLEK